MKVATLAVGIAIVAVLGYGWLREHDRRVREAAAAQRSQDSLVHAVDFERAARGAEHRRDSLASARAIGQRDAALAGARHTADSLEGILGPLIDSLEAVLPDSLSPYAKRVLAAWTAHLDADLRERAAADSALAGLKADLMAMERTYAADLSTVTAQLDEALRQLAAANARARPGLLRRAATILPWAAGAYGLGRLMR